MKFSADKINELYKVKAKEFLNNQRAERDIKKLVGPYISKIKKEILEAALEGKKELSLSFFYLLKIGGI